MSPGATDAQEGYTMDNLPENGVVFDGRVYKVPEEFYHPGGDIINLHFGRDVSAHYRMMHVTHDAGGAVFKKYFEDVGPLINTAPAAAKGEYQYDTPFWSEVRRAVAKAIPRDAHAPLAVWPMYIAITLYICAFKVYWATTGGALWLAPIFALSHNLPGLHFNHVCEHFQIKDGWVHRFFSILGGHISQTGTPWFMHHQEHHAYTQHRYLDPDVAFTSDKAGHKLSKWETYFAILVRMYEGLHMPWGWKNKERNTFVLNKYVRQRAWVEYFWRCILCFGLVLTPPILKHGLMWGILIDFVFAGFFRLGGFLVFAPNHIEEGIEIYDDDDFIDADGVKKPPCWAKTQIMSSANFGGFWLNILTGGLNYQIEHHLFPRVHWAYYPTIAPIIRKIADKHNVRYCHHDTWGDALRAVAKTQTPEVKERRRLESEAKKAAKKAN